MAIVGVVVVYASTVEEEEFSIDEDEDSLLMAKDGQQQVREVKLAEMREARLIAEKEAEEERLRVEAAIKAKEEEEARRVAEAIEAKKAKDVKSSTSSKSSAPSQSGTNLGTFEATAYGADCAGCSGITANGTDIRNGNIYVDGYRVIAADTSVIPMNSIVRITYSSGKTEMAKVCDVGGAIRGKIIDVAFATEAETPAFGRQQVQIELIK